MCLGMTVARGRARRVVTGVIPNIDLPGLALILNMTRRAAYGSRAIVLRRKLSRRQMLLDALIQGEHDSGMVIIYFFPSLSFPSTPSIDSRADKQDMCFALNCDLNGTITRMSTWASLTSAGPLR